MHASKFTKFKFIVHDARVFPGIWFDFIYPNNSSLFFATPQIYVAANKICKQTFYYCSLSSSYIKPEIPTNSA